jgi:hypothetical protein
VFQATAAIRFFISGMNKSQWERDRLLRSKEMNTAGLPSRQLISLGYGVKGPSDARAAKITAPAELNIGVYQDRLAATPAARSYAQEGRSQLRDARAVLSAHLKALLALGMLRITATNAPDRVLLCDPFGVVHLTHTQTDVTMYWRMTDDSATLARFAQYQMPMFSVSLQLIDDADVFYRSFSNLITRPQLLLLAFERELTVSARYYGPALRAAVDAVAAAPIVITIDDDHVRARAACHQSLRVGVCVLTFTRACVVAAGRACDTEVHRRVR